MAYSLLGRVNSFLYRAVKEILIFSGLALIAITFVGVVTRYILKVNVDWAYEVSMILLVWVAFLGTAAATRSKEHIFFDMVMKLLSPKGRFVFRVARDIVVMLFVVFGIYFGYKVALRTLAQEFQTINLPVGLLYSSLPVGFLLMFLFSLEDLIGAIKAGPAGETAEAN